MSSLPDKSVLEGGGFGVGPFLGYRQGGGYDVSCKDKISPSIPIYEK